MNILTINEPVVGEHSARFSWTLEPASPLYNAAQFELRFPDAVDLSVVPRELWWRIALLCMHPHWPLLAPLRVVLPVGLPPGEREFWLRLTDAAVAVLDYRAGREATRRQIELVDSGPPIDPPSRSHPEHAAPHGVVACFSGGRDSTTQVGLLREIGASPVLVATTSPVWWSHEHDAERRREVFEQTAKRGPFELLEVETDWRAAWDNSFSMPAYRVAVHELSDCFLFVATALVVASARNARLVAIASEAEVQESVRRGGMVVQHHHFMYSAATHRALSALFEPAGIAIGSLNYPLRQFQVQRVLAERYHDLREQQYSCWSLGAEETACSRCTACLENAVNLLSSGASPALAGVDLATLIGANAPWDKLFAPREEPARDADEPRPATSPSAAVGYSVREHTIAALASIPESLVDEMLEGHTDREAVLQAFCAYRDRARALPATTEPGYRAGYLELVDEQLRGGLQAILDEQFDREPAERYAALLANSRTLGDWVATPLRRTASPRDTQTTEQRGPVSRPPAATALTPAELEAVAMLLPAPEPPLNRDPAGRDGPVRVADTLLDGNELAYVTEAVETNWVSSAGPFVTRFEHAFAEACGVRFGVACSSGTTALHLALAAAGIGPGDEVLIPTFTMIATANAVRYLGADPVLLDAERDSWNLATDQIVSKLSARTRAIVVMHTYGNPVDMDAVHALADRNGLVVIEDAAEAHGASYQGRPIGSLGAVAAFSFYGNKIVTTGEGGMVVTDAPEIADVARSLRDHAFSPERHFWHQRLAFNYRMGNLQAAVGLAQTERLDELVGRRRATAARYREALRDIPGVGLPPPTESAGGVPWMFGITVGGPAAVSRDELRSRLAQAGVETRSFFVPIHLQPIYRARYRNQRYPVAEELGRTGLYIPSGAGLHASDIDYVAETIRDALLRTPAVVSGR